MLSGGARVWQVATLDANTGVIVQTIINPVQK